MMGISSKLNLPKAGGSASSGRSPNTAFILRCASCKAISTSMSSTNSMVMMDTLSMDVDLIWSIPSNEARASSSFMVTEFSTSDGAAPGYTVETVSTLGLNFGKSSYDIWVYEKSPASVSMVKITTTIVDLCIDIFAICIVDSLDSQLKLKVPLQRFRLSN